MKIHIKVMGIKFNDGSSKRTVNLKKDAMVEDLLYSCRDLLPSEIYQKNVRKTLITVNGIHVNNSFILHDNDTVNIFRMIIGG